MQLVLGKGAGPGAIDIGNECSAVHSATSQYIFSIDAFEANAVYDRKGLVGAISRRDFSCPGVSERVLDTESRRS